MKKEDSYSRRAVAMYLFPSASSSLAVARLRRWIKGDYALLKALQKRGYRAGTHRFTPALRQLLIDHIGKG